MIIFAQRQIWPRGKKILWQNGPLCGPSLPGAAEKCGDTHTSEPQNRGGKATCIGQKNVATTPRDLT